MDINPVEFAALVILAVLIFGPDKLPELARKTARVIQQLRKMANSATQTVRNELGPGYENLELSDLNPQAFVTKHILGDAVEVRDEINSAARLAQEQAASIRSETDQATLLDPPTPARKPVRFDSDAT